jgi:hypothetical protein
MGIIIANPPEGGLQIIESALTRFRNQPNLAAVITSRSAAADTLNAAVPHPVYFVGIKSLTKGKLLSAAVLRGWRYLLLNENEPYAATELNLNKRTGSLRFSHVNYGALLERTIDGLAFAEKLEPVNRSDYELRLLDMPDLYIVALWLHGAEDLIIPILLGSAEINTFTVYTESEFINLLKDKSLMRLRFDETGADKQIFDDQ